MKQHRSDGFSLLEVMIVVLIIAILAAVAIPDYRRMEVTARRSEGYWVLENVRLAEAVYMVDYETYVAGLSANSKLKIVGNIPEPSDLRFYKLDRSYVSASPHDGYCVRLAGNIDRDPVPDVLTLRVGPSNICPILTVGSPPHPIPESIALINDDAIL